jgi:hypothetical protein
MGRGPTAKQEAYVVVPATAERKNRTRSDKRRILERPFPFGSGIELGWRTEPKLNWCEAFDDDHGAPAQRASPEWGRRDLVVRDCYWIWRRRKGGERLLADRQQCAAAAAGQKPKMSDTDEPARQYVQQKPAQELIGRQRRNNRLYAGSSSARRAASQRSRA